MERRGEEKKETKREEFVEGYPHAGQERENKDRAVSRRRPLNKAYYGNLGQDNSQLEGVFGVEYSRRGNFFFAGVRSFADAFAATQGA
jgi:hypothetical protein